MAIETMPICMKKMLTITVQQMLAYLQDAKRDPFVVSAAHFT
jgi:hypothetical protein